MRKGLKKAGILLIAFVAALVLFAKILNRGTEDMTVNMGEATLPRISFRVAEQSINPLAGYTQEMDITAVRDTITPLTSGEELRLQTESFGRTIEKIQYEVYSLDGSETYLNGQAKEGSEEIFVLKLRGAIPEDTQEAVLKVILSVDAGEDTQKVYYYTRIVRQDGLSLRECLDFAGALHENTFKKTEKDMWETYLEPGEESDNTTYQTVNIHSDIEHIQWGDLSPEIISEVEWSIKESNTVYTSMLVKYQVECGGEAQGIYNIREFFRVRCIEGEMYLLSYDRTMNEVFDGANSIEKDGVMLGLTDEHIPYVTNEKGDVLAFVQERELWSYNRGEHTLALVFSFGNADGQDVRSRNDEHAVRIIEVQDSGSMTFAVYGYMNRGTHEGLVGAGVYYYDAKECVIEEKAFIPSKKSFAIAEEELGKLVYFAQEKQILYVLAGGNLYRIDMEKNEQTMLAEGLTDEQYVVSDDGSLLAYQPEGTLERARQTVVLNLATEETYTMAAPDGEAIRPLGFIGQDFVCGYVKESNRGKTPVGEELLPINRLEIWELGETQTRTYVCSDKYISDIFIEDNMMTLNCVERNGNIYTRTEADYVTSTKERQHQTVLLESISTLEKERQLKFTFTKEIQEETGEKESTGADGDTSLESTEKLTEGENSEDKVQVRLLYPPQVIAEEPLTVSFDDEVEENKYYVYGKGKLIDVYHKAAYAIQKAEQVSGVVISSEQAYIWESGNRALAYDTGAEPFQVVQGQSSLDACMDYMKRYQAEEVDFSGGTLSQMLYVIQKGIPVIAMTDANHAILLVGYTTKDVTYVEPNDGTKHVIAMSDLETILAAGGNIFIGYVE